MKLLIVEDHIAFLQGLVDFLESKLGGDWAISSASSGTAALQIFNQKHSINVLMTDLNLPGINGSS